MERIEDLPKLRKVEVDCFDVIAVLLVHFVHQVVDQVCPLDSMQVLKYHMHIEQRRLKHVQQRTVSLLVEHD